MSQPEGPLWVKGGHVINALAVSLLPPKAAEDVAVPKNSASDLPGSGSVLSHSTVDWGSNLCLVLSVAIGSLSRAGSLPSYR
jgi:hypothetical protein